MYEVQTYTICDGWVNTWLCDNTPEFFETFTEAVHAMEDHLINMKFDNMEFNRADYRVHFNKEGQVISKKPQ